MKKIVISFLGLLVILGLSTRVFSNTTSAPSYSNMFISYVSPQDVQTLANYNSSLQGYFVWTLEGDVDPVSAQQDSLFAALKKAKASNQEVAAYWANWSVYKTERALLTPTYGVPGSVESDGSTKVQNTDFVDKLGFIDTLIYSFLEVNTDPTKGPVGTVYFNDPWADLLPKDSFCNKNPICTIGVPVGKTFEQSSIMGNFEAFAALPQTYPNLKTVISIGGYGHDNSFEVLFEPNGAIDPTKVKAFVNSINALVTHYKLSGVDLDYENTAMTSDQSKSYLQVIQALNATLPANVTITVAILAGPDYISGKNQVGFAPGVLAQIAGLSNVKAINLMTYDFHGAFDFVADGSGRTGFLSNLYMPADAPAGYQARFSIDSSIKALESAGVPIAKINAGVPAYGRALANIAPSNGGLFNTLPANTQIPRGDWDTATCIDTLPLAADNACSGSFSYQYIVNHLLKEGFNSTEHSDADVAGGSNNIANGSTAYAATWSGGPSYSLEITNTGAATGYYGIQVVISDATGKALFTSDYLGPAADARYESTSAISAIEGLKGLKVAASFSNPVQTIACTTPASFDFTSNYHLMLKVSQTNPAVIACAFSPIQ